MLTRIDDPSCPHCQQPLENRDIIDIDICDDDCTHTVTGECPLCERVFIWEEKFTKASNALNLREA